MAYCKLNFICLKVKIIKNQILSGIYRIMVSIILEKFSLSAYLTSNFFDQAVIDNEDVFAGIYSFRIGLNGQIDEC